MENENENVTYSIVRFYQDENKPYEVQETGLSMQEAMDHCKQDHSTGDGWFDGWMVDE